MLSRYALCAGIVLAITPAFAEVHITCGSEVYLQENTIRENSCDIACRFTKGGGGGGVYIRNSEVHFFPGNKIISNTTVGVKKRTDGGGVLVHAISYDWPWYVPFWFTGAEVYFSSTGKVNEIGKNTADGRGGGLANMGDILGAPPPRGSGIRIRNCRVYQNTGSSGPIGTQADGLYFADIATVIIDGATVENHPYGNGITMFRYDHKTYFRNCIIKGNAVGFYARYSDPVVRDCNIAGNRAYGMFASRIANIWGAVHAKNNWWGAATGPYHPTANPAGTGDRVSDNVTFRPYKKRP